MTARSSRGVVLAVSAAGVGLAAVYLVEALRYPRGTMATPGPGLYPLLVAALLFVGAVGTAVETLVRRAESVVEWPQPAEARRLLWILAAVVGYVALLLYVGHAVAGTLSALVILHAMGMRSWPRKVVLALVAGVGSHLLFTVVLGVPLPAGPRLG